MHQTQRLSLALQLHRLQHKTQKLMNKSKKSQRKIRQAPRCSKLLWCFAQLCTCFHVFSIRFRNVPLAFAGATSLTYWATATAFRPRPKPLTKPLLKGGQIWRSAQSSRRHVKMSSKGKIRQVCSLFGSTLVCFLPIPNKSLLCFSVYQFCQETAHDEKGQSWSKASE